MLSKAAFAVGYILAYGSAVAAQIQVSPDRIAAAQALVDASGDGENIAHHWSATVRSETQTQETESCRTRRVEVIGKFQSEWVPIVRNELVLAYADHLTAEESKRVTKFFQSAAGIAFRKAVEEINRKERPPTIMIYGSVERGVVVAGGKKVSPDKLQMAIDGLNSQDSEAVTTFSKTRAGQKFFLDANGYEAILAVNFKSGEAMFWPLKNPDLLKYKAEC